MILGSATVAGNGFLSPIGDGGTCGGAKKADVG